MRTMLVLASFSASLAGPAQGQAARDALVECSGIADAPARLQCFDTAARHARDAPGEPAAKEEDFGKPPAPRAEVTQITVTVLELARTTRGQAIFMLDNGQTWRQLEADGTKVWDPPPGKALRVTIAKGLLDSYNLTIEGRNGLIKVRRLK